jgi:hypothetical protein
MNGVMKSDGMKWYASRQVLVSYLFTFLLNDNFRIH